jgi:glutaredoxin-like YruB-family protein
MKLIDINSHSELINHLKGTKSAYLLLYKKGSDQSDCAKNNLKSVDLDNKEMVVMAADVSKVRDIHTQYGITSAPTLLEFENEKFKNNIRGCQKVDFYKSYFENIVFNISVEGEEKPAKRVTVYTTPTCTWCNTLKTFLRKNGIRYTEVDVASNQSAAQDMVRKSGQQGVPQTDINGEIVIGFDQAKLNRLLEIKPK